MIKWIIKWLKGKPVPKYLDGKNKECTICSSDVDIENRGGVIGEIGILPVAFCEWCYAGIDDMISQNCVRCIEAAED
jgi:hypothetical protein|tara:strand:- start:616 stop:846 length:231 start_codon:yes stop_codon:yes gene_type:complete